MLAIVTPEEMAAVDAAATEPVEVVIERAGAAVAWAARDLLGGLYGTRIVVIAGKGNNGADGRVAARRLREWGARVDVRDATAPGEIPAADLVIDAAYGTGLTRGYTPPDVTSSVLAVDIPSGVNGLTGEISEGALVADATVTFQALKPGLLFPPGAPRCGEVTVVDLGLDTSAARAHLVEGPDVSSWVPARPVDSHKWRSACWVVAGSPGMTGAAALAAGAAARSGAGYVRLSSPGADTVRGVGAEVVQHALAESGWAAGLGDSDRFGATVIGPGLGRGATAGGEIRAALAAIRGPVVLDADGLAAVAGSPDLLRTRPGPTVITPHDGEFEQLTGTRPGPDRIDAARALAAASGAVTLLKGPATVVAAPDGEVLVSATGDQRLATAGTGDVLAGIIGGLLAAGTPALEAAACGAWIHGKAAQLAPRHAMVASDLLTTLPEVIDASHLG